MLQSPKILSRRKGQSLPQSPFFSKSKAKPAAREPSFFQMNPQQSSRSLIQRSEDPMITEESPLYESGSRIPASGVFEQAIEQMYWSTSPIEKNTARKFTSGAIQGFYFNELEIIDELADGMIQVRTPSRAVTRIAKDRLNLADGMYVGANVIIRDSLSLEKAKDTIIHETNHSLNYQHDTRILGKLREDSDGMDINAVWTYIKEFRSNWVGNFRTITDLDQRAAKIREKVVLGYPVVALEFQNNPKFEHFVKNYNRPDQEANLLNE